MAHHGNVHVRRNAWTLPSGDKTLDHYAKAVAIMKSRHATDPTSWTYQAAMHGTHATPVHQLWNGCQHGTWFFLPWHRMFIYFFEQIVRAAVVQAGGPAGWTLPFWNYGAGGQGATIPKAFRQPTVNGQPNPLYVQRRASGINNGLALSPAVASPAHALNSHKYTGTGQFGGGITPAAQFSQKTGRLEQTPHNDVHNAVGGANGLMADPDAAAADPIFWLHHANIDRVWAAWTGPSHKDPTDGRWTGHQFSFFDAHGHLVHKKCSDVRDIVNQLGYTYEAVSTPHIAAVAGPPPPGGAPPEEAAVTADDSEDEGEIVGASDTPAVRLVGAPAEVSFEIDPRAAQTALKDAGAEQPNHVYLSVDDIEAEQNPGTTYGIYVNLPADASPTTAGDHHAGNVSFFGIERARNPRGDEPPHGLRSLHEITHLVQRLQTAGEWDGEHVDVTFRPIGLIPADEPELAHALPETVVDSDPPVTIGRVSVSYS